jgi:multicomponent Na+:H+ antiporter subunit E
MKSTRPNSGDVLAPVLDTPAGRETVEHAADRLGPDARLHLVALTGPDRGPSSETAAVLADARRRARRALDGDDRRARVASAGRVVDGRWPTTEDVASTLIAYADEHGVQRAVLPADLEGAFPGVTAGGLAAALRDAGLADPVVGPRHRPAVHRRLLVAGSLAGTGALFVLSLAFYLLLAGTVDAFEVVTGAATAAVVAAVFGRVTFARPPAPVRSTARALRGCLYVPYLLWEVAKANLAVAAIVLHPRLPLDPKLVSYRSNLDGELALTTFANSVTLTPGTLTVDVDAESGDLLVHTLTARSRADLLDGSLERAVRFVFADRGTPTDEGSTRVPGGTEEGLDD